MVTHGHVRKFKVKVFFFVFVFVQNTIPSLQEERKKRLNIAIPIGEEYKTKKGTTDVIPFKKIGGDLLFHKLIIIDCYLFFQRR